MEKNLARKIYKEIRNNIKNKDIKDNIIFNKVINDKNILSKETILIYIPINNEVDTIKIINYFLPTKNIAIPKVIGNDMKFCYIKDLTHLKKGPFNILESQTNNYVTDFHNTICIVPGICFDKNNNRIGYGKGYYDKFLKNNKIESIGLCYKECIIKSINTTYNDQKVNKVITD